MANTTNNTRAVRRKKYSSQPLRKLSGWSAWMSYTSAFEAYTREPGLTPLSLCVLLGGLPHLARQNQMIR